MTTICNAVNTTFTPATGQFNVQCTRGSARLDRRQTAGADWAVAGYVNNGQAMVVDNLVASTDYRFVTMDGTPVVQADQ